MTTVVLSETVLEQLTRLHPKVIDLSLGRIERLLARLGNPHEALACVVHVAGTNGKGSVIAYLRAALEAAGLVVHAYTSPHLVAFHERIRVAGRLIEEEVLYRLLLECKNANGEAPITFFEITTSAAFLAFARTPADVTLLETGLGGRLDATNVIARPALTVITPVSVDHVGFLGDTVEKIAFEKAGILKLGVPAVIGRQGPKALAVIEARAAELGAPVHRLGREWSVASGPGDAGLAFAFDGASESFPAPGLVGSHQYDNAGTALAALSLLARHPGGPSVPHPAIGAGLTQVEWPARLQRLADGPISEIPPAGWELWLDGGHNTAAAEALAAASAAWSDRPLYLVMGMMRTKDPVPFLAHLAPHASGLRAVPIPGHDDCFDPAELARHAEGASLCAAAAVGVTAAIADLARAHRQAPGGDAPARVLICGSLYLAGNVLRSSG